MSIEKKTRLFTHQGKILIIALMLMSSVLLTHYSHAVLQIGAVFTHFFYVPIILSALWWQRKGLIVAFILLVYLLLSDYFFRGGVTPNDYLRALMFLVISAVVGLLAERLRKANKALEESVDRYSAILDHMHDGVAVFRTDDGGNHFQIIDINGAGEFIDRVTNSSIKGKHFTEAFPDLRDSGLIDALERVWRTGKPERCDFRFCRDDRPEGWRENFVYKLPSGEVVVVYRDRTKEKEAEEQLRELAAIVESSNDAIVSLSLEGNILSWNRAATRIYGYGPEEMIGRSVFSLMRPELRQDTVDNIARIRTGQRIEHYESMRIRKDGIPIHVSLTLSPVAGPDNAIRAISVISRDITRRKEVDEALRKAHDELEQRVEERTNELRRINETLSCEVENRKRVEEALRESSEKVKVFAYSVCHDLKSPAIAIHGFTRLLKERHANLLGGKGIAYCDQILKASRELGELVEEVNAYISAGNAIIKFELMKTDEFLNEILKAFEAQFLTRGIRCYVSCDPAVIRADRLSLLRAFRNLVENALKHGGPGLSEIRLGYEVSKDFNIFSVSDNGKGIGDLDARKMFDPFQRGQPALHVEGAGLGLAIVKEVAKQHRGKVFAFPRPEGGVTFFLSVSKTL
jgi:PAS domain S-box-containing protein